MTQTAGLTSSCSRRAGIIMRKINGRDRGELETRGWGCVTSLSNDSERGAISSSHWIWRCRRHASGERRFRQRAGLLPGARRSGSVTAWRALACIANGALRFLVPAVPFTLVALVDGTLKIAVGTWMFVTKREHAVVDGIQSHL